jgi:hypothetical protein
MRLIRMPFIRRRSSVAVHPSPFIRRRSAVILRPGRAILAPTRMKAGP